MNQTLTRSNRFVLGANLLLALLLVAGYTKLLRDYWAYYHMGTAGGSAMYLGYIVIPFSVLGFVTVAVLAYWLSSRKRFSLVGGIAFGAISLLITFVLLFAIEARRTAGYPTENGKPVSVSAFLRTYF